MTLAVDNKPLASGTFGSFTMAFAKGSVDTFERSVVVLGKLDETLFDVTTLATAAGVSTLNTTLGTPMQVTGGTVGLVAGSAAIGSVIGRTSTPSVTPVITAGAYTAGMEVGGLMTFAVGGAGSGTVQSISVICKSVQTTALYLNIFDTNPTNSTWTDHSTPAINALDVPFLRGAYLLTSPYSGLGTHTVWNLDGIGMQFVGANLYGILIAVATPTFATTSGVTVKLGIIDD